MSKLLDYYAGDEFASTVWQGKYALKNSKKVILEQTPWDMHKRMSDELARVESKYWLTDKAHDALSDMGKRLHKELHSTQGETHLLTRWVFKYLDRYKYIIPQGSIMSMLGNKYVVGSLSNCFVIPGPVDSYGGIFMTDQQVAQLEKRRGGVGTNLNKLRPEDAPVLNAAVTSTGAHSFMDRFSNTTREVAQNGRRGALMLLMSVLHPDIFKFVSKKKDLDKVTGANISVQLTDEFMEAVRDDKDFLCRFPIDSNLTLRINTENAGVIEMALVPEIDLEYNKIVSFKNLRGEDVEVMKIRAKELYDLIIEMAWLNGEPGLAFMDNIINYSPEGVYSQYRPIASNPCGEQWMNAYDACRLLALNFYNIVDNHFTNGATIDYDKLYEIAYVQQRLADNIVDLEIEYVQRIIDKIVDDPEPMSVKFTELDLWENIKKTAQASRRTGCGFTAMADMIAALGLKYDSDEAIAVIKKVMQTKFRGEMDCSIDMAITRGTFDGWDPDKEFRLNDQFLEGKSPFYQMVVEEFPDIAHRMYVWGRRNVSLSTVAPTGTVSIVALLSKYANTSAGIEPVFATHYFRNKKVNPSDRGVRIDFVDQNGDSWMTYPVVMGGFKEWIEAQEGTGIVSENIELLTKEQIEDLFRMSPYYGSCAADISWEKRLEIQSTVQRYTTNAISSTLNLPKETSKEVVAQIYNEAWKLKLKGVTIYRDGSRTGVLVTEQRKDDSFTYRDAVKRPKELDSELSIVTVKGQRYGVIIGLMENKPYEIFAFNMTDKQVQPCKGKTTKVKKGHYDFTCSDGTLRNIQEAAIHNDELVLTRLISGMLRHGAKPQFVMEQIDKCDLEVVSFGAAIKRVLKKYCSEEEMVSRSKCKSCGSSNLKMQEGCLICLDCSESKCG